MTYINAGGAQVKLYNNLIYLMGWQTGGIGLALTSPFNVDPCNSTTHWTGATLVGAGIGNTGTGAMTRTFTPFFDMSGHRYLRIAGAITTAATPQNRVVTIGGKTWNITFPTVAADILIDLCNPTTGGADSDTTDGMWSVAGGDPNPTLVYGADSGTVVAAGPGDGPLWGVTYCTSLALSGFAVTSTESFASLDMVMQNEATGHFLCQWEPRFDSLLIQGPDWSVPASGGGDTVFTVGVTRGFILTTDGRQSAEYPSYALLRTEGGASGITTYGVTNWSIAQMAASVNNGISIDGGPVGSDANYFNYAVKPNGWTATVAAAANDHTSNLNAGFLNRDLPASWVCYGVKYASGGFTSSVGVNLTSGGGQGAQALMSSLDFYPGCGDVFGLGGGSPAANTIYLGASKIYRAQAHGILMNKPTNVPGPGSTATLYPGAGEIQPAGTPVGNGTADSPQAVYRCTGDGLDGFDAVTVGPTTTVSDTVGTVTARTGTGAPQSVSQTFGEAKLSRVCFRLPVATATLGRVFVYVDEAGVLHTIDHWYDMTGAIQGLLYRRGDAGHPRPGYPWDAIVVVTSNPADDNPVLAGRMDGRLYLVWDRQTAPGGGGSPRTATSYMAHSDDHGATWSTPVVMGITNGQFPFMFISLDGFKYVAAYVDDGTGHNTGTIMGQFQHPGQAALSTPFTFQKWTGSAWAPIAVQEGSFAMSRERDYSNRWIMICKEVGASATSIYLSADDEGGTWVLRP